jgi:transcriptional regulator with XRE-family HTH domain
MRFGETVRRLRKARNLSQEALAERAGMNADFVGFIERGENVPTLTTILQLARALGVQPSVLIRDFDSENRADGQMEPYP